MKEARLEATKRPLTPQKEIKIIFFLHEVSWVNKKVL